MPEVQKSDIVLVSQDDQEHAAIVNRYNPARVGMIGLVDGAEVVLEPAHEESCDLTIFTGSPYAPVQVAQAVPYSETHTIDRTTWRRRGDGQPRDMNAIAAFSALAATVNVPSVPPSQAVPPSDAEPSVPVSRSVLESTPTVDPSQAAPLDTGGQVSSDPPVVLGSGDGSPGLAA